MEKLRAAVIGLGIGEQHIGGYESHPAVEVTVICDISEEAVEKVYARNPDKKIISDPQEVLESPDIDVVSIASYDDCHYEQTLTALKNGKHVFVEKPFVLRPGEARSIRAALAENPHLKLSSNLILRMSPRFRRVRVMISEGRFGKVYYTEGDYNYGRIHKIIDGWRGKQDYYSVVHSGGVHIIDLMMWLTGDRIKTVKSYGSSIATEGTGFRFFDTVATVMKFESGALGKMTANFGCVMPHFHCLQVYGQKATFTNGQEHGLLYESSDPEVAPLIIDEQYRGVHKGALIYSFIEQILNGSKPEVTADDVFQTMSVCFAIEESAASGKEIEVEYI